jgi:hypothetical protein
MFDDFSRYQADYRIGDNGPTAGAVNAARDRLRRHFGRSRIIAEPLSGGKRAVRPLRSRYEFRHDWPLLPCSGGGLLFLQRICSKRRRDPLIRAGFMAASSKFCSKCTGKRTANTRPPSAPTHGTGCLVLPQCGGFRVIALRMGAVRHRPKRR